jgi:hypothetical protein
MRMTRQLTTARHRERGSALTMIPVLVLIIVMAAGLVVDSAIGFTAKRALVDTAAAAANDAANGLDTDSLFESGSVRLDAGLVNRIAARTVAARGDGLQDVKLVSARIVDAEGRPAVQVVLTGTAHKVFGVFGEREWKLRATVVSTARQDD